MEDDSPGKGFGALSYPRSQIDAVIRYIQNQQTHHARRTFRQEYIEFLRKFQVNYNERYIFEAA